MGPQSQDFRSQLWRYADCVSLDRLLLSWFALCLRRAVSSDGITVEDK